MHEHILSPIAYVLQVVWTAKQAAAVVGQCTASHFQLLMLLQPKSPDSSPSHKSHGQWNTPKANECCSGWSVGQCGLMMLK